MPPKKAEETEPKVLLGRVGTNLQVGIVGMPNVGKSTFFNVITKSSIPAENFPFCTIDPNSARCPVPDDRFDWLVEHYKPASAVPAWLQIVDIAGLVKGAAEGQGLGNAFLSHVKACDALFHMVRVFDDPDVTHVEGAVDPVRDLEIIEGELIAKDLEWVTVRKDLAEVAVRRNGKDKKKQEELDVLTKIFNVLTEKKLVRTQTWHTNEIDYLNELQLLTAKPGVFLVNMSEEDFFRKKNKFLPKIAAWVKERTGEQIIPYSAAFEHKVADMDADQRKAYFEQHQVTSQLEKIIKVGFSVLNLIYYFTAGHDEVKCWMIQRGTKAPQAAGRIHTDMEHGFIKAEVFAFADMKELGTEGAVKAGGKYRMEGKNYVMNDGDIVFFRFNPSGGSGGGAKKK